MARVRVSSFSVPDFAIALVAIILAVAAADLFRFVLSRQSSAN